MEKPKCFEDAARQVAHELTELLIAKQHDYGHSNITDFGEFGVLIRANDKMARLKNLLPLQGRGAKNESIEDSWCDLSNYGIIALMLRRGWFNLPLREDNNGQEATKNH
jgi:hypothetical protein